MGLITELPKILKASYAKAEKLLSAPPRAKEWHSRFDAEISSVVWSENSELLSLPVIYGKADMIYCDPPFYTQNGFKTRVTVRSEIYPDISELVVNAYEDKWKSKAEYLKMLTVRLILMKESLKSTGSIFIHLDQRAAHPVKLLMDEIFGEKNYINEIIWSYKSGGATKRRLARKHDVIFFYSRTKDYRFNEIKEKSYNRNLKPYRFKGVEEFKDDTGWYTLINARDVWNINMVGRTSSERVSYASQKPEELVSKLIEMTTAPGDMCADFFCGSGTLGVCASKLNRRFICCDENALAVHNTVSRLRSSAADFDIYGISGGLSEENIENITVDKKYEAQFELLKRDDPGALKLLYPLK